MRPIGIVATGDSITTSGTSASVAIPTTAAGTAPQFVRVATTVAAYVKVGDEDVAATTDDILVTPEDSLLLKVSGQTHVAAIQVASAGVVNVCPLEDAHL